MAGLAGRRRAEAGAAAVMLFDPVLSYNAVFYCARGPNSAADLRLLLGGLLDLPGEFDLAKSAAGITYIHS